MQKVLEGSQIRLYFRKQTANFENNLFKSVCAYDEHAIHDLRVSIKRIRALFRFLNEYRILRPHSRKYLETIKKIYAPLGVLRDLQIKSSLVSEYHIDAIADYIFFLKWMGAQQFRSKVKLKNVFRQFSFSEFYRFKHRLPYVKNNNIQLDSDRILEKRLLKINRLLGKTRLEEELHEIRKKLKDIYYFLEMCGLEHSECLGISLDLQSIKSLEDMIGNWHDNLLFLRDLNLDRWQDGGDKATPKDDLTAQILQNMDDLYPLIISALDHYRLSPSSGDSALLQQDIELNSN